MKYSLSVMFKKPFVTDPHTHTQSRSLYCVFIVTNYKMTKGDSCTRILMYVCMYVCMYVSPFLTHEASQYSGAALDVYSKGSCF